MSDNEYDDDVFDDFELDNDDVFDGIDEDELVELERPGKRLKVEAPPEARDDSPEGGGHLALAEQLLSKQFGYQSFRHEQAAAIQRILAGDNALVIFPTGAGKSLCYQIPAIAFPELDRAEGARASRDAGVTVVVSPLIALMKDQVDALKKRGIPAESIDSSKKWEELQVVYDALRRSQLRILYCAPERLNNEGFVETVKRIPGGIRLLAVDEAHCVSEWGHSFRPDYLKVARFVDEIKAERVICLTATATPKVAEDICKAFSIKPACVFRTTPYRPNLELQAKTVCKEYDGDISVSLGIMLGFHAKSEGDKRFEELFKFLRANPGPTLVYVAMQQQCEIHAKVLGEQGFKAAPFHAGLKTEHKQQVQDDFMSGKVDIVCATIAFGMGIDKPNIRNVVHWDLSNTVEEYSQQIGRAGRDGKPSKCMFYLAPSAFYLREVFARGDLPSRTSLAGLVFDIFKEALGVPVGGIFKTNHYRQQKDFDIRPSPLSVIYATLELHFGLFRATTPEYSTYKFEAMPSYFRVTKEDKTAVADAILKNSKKKVKWYDIDVNEAAAYKSTGLNRGDIVAKLNQLDQQGHIRLQASGLTNRYILQKALPKTPSEKEKVVDKLYKDLASREKDALQRCKKVMGLITGSKCFALSLAEHFGMGLPEGKEKCGHCSFCLTGKPVEPPRLKVTATTASSIQQVLKATDVRDDPRFLARVAYGIRSPRVTALKLDKSPVFRSLADHDFEALLAEFTKACQKKGEK
ncbi:P-loop containing nucleoside triphosphate hydrolase protein [Triangularia verruculosa]|uniref:DNA 3'-5' helicase n=1 Tax=Triangularia verruculosa TaxID=2587418 RepID=A0AAN7APV8_9PEZI|nr:P-loop containing nucleoside triphosphate hydrolase protein [Triangularia verruculosa]